MIRKHEFSWKVIHIKYSVPNIFAFFLQYSKESLQRFLQNHENKVNLDVKKSLYFSQRRFCGQSIQACNINLELLPPTNILQNKLGLRDEHFDHKLCTAAPYKSQLVSNQLQNFILWQMKFHRYRRRKKPHQKIF